MTNREVFRFCPQCGKPAVTAHSNGSIECSACRFVLFMNVASAAGAIITDEQGRILLLRRSRDPQKGKLAAPGGFIDAGESAEEALCREVREEVNLEVTSTEYLCSFPNRYDYKGVIYPTEDLYFLCAVRSLASLKALDEVESCLFVAPGEIDMDQIAFPTMRQALRLYLQARATGIGK